MHLRDLARLLALSTTVWLAACDFAPSAEEIAEAEAQVAHSEHPERVFWGDTHLHSDNSPDAYGRGNRLSAEDAFRFARGEKVTSTLGVEAQLARPLDFLVISDHSDGLGFTKRIANAPHFLLPNDQLKRWHDMSTGETANTIGAAELQAVWADPEFNPNQRAFYYVRALEIPTARWVLFDKIRSGLNLPDNVELVSQERAISSPIWYTPQG